ncbi:MAG: hypothetical protein BWK80_55980 [Desulfobacteraceae bacterium IS3]|nr:MAG: hypothetical protein BWK80_55980 [Desulfobacteraceae bacterium IS3]
MYLLDTNILSELIKKQPNPYLRSHLNSKPSNSLFTSSICVMELRFGSALRQDAEAFWLKITQEILKRVRVISIGFDEAVMAGDILASLQKRGQPIGIEDVLIASAALAHHLTLITANIRHFSRIENLIIENWLNHLG